MQGENTYFLKSMYWDSKIKKLFWIVGGNDKHKFGNNEDITIVYFGLIGKVPFE